MNKWTEEEVRNTLDQVSKRASTDADFRKLCLDNPALAIKEVSGKELPVNLKMRFVENEGAHMTFVLPDMVNTEELDDEELNQVAGGTGFMSINVCKPYI